MTDATPLNDDDLRVFAQDELDRHTPANQEGNGYERCALCHYTRHPCDVYDLAAAVLRLLDEKPARDLDGQIIVTKTGRVMTEGEIAALADEAEAGYDVGSINPLGIQEPGRGQ